MRSLALVLTGALLMMSGADAATTKRPAAKKAASVKKSAMPTKATLHGMVVVIDPGHGGTDRGSAGYFGNGRKKALVAEDEYVYDVALRVATECRRLGAKVILTIRDPKQAVPSNLPANRVIPTDKREVYTMSGGQVRAGTSGLAPRVLTANRALWNNRGKRVVDVSIHFDATPKRELEGITLIAPPGPRPEVVQYLYEEVRTARRLRSRGGREYYPVVQSGGGDGHGERSLYILSPRTNAVRQRVMVELGNFRNVTDVWRIRNPRTRQAYAEIITRALVRVNTFVPLAKCRSDPNYKPASRPSHHSGHRR